MFFPKEKIFREAGKTVDDFSNGFLGSDAAIWCKMNQNEPKWKKWKN